MAAVTVTFPAETAEQAAELAAAIREAGSLMYTNVEDNTVNVQVGTVETS